MLGHRGGHQDALGEGISGSNSVLIGLRDSSVCGQLMAEQPQSTSVRLVESFSGLTEGSVVRICSCRVIGALKLHHDWRQKGNRPSHKACPVTCHGSLGHPQRCQGVCRLEAYPAQGVPGYLRHNGDKSELLQQWITPKSGKASTHPSSLWLLLRLEPHSLVKVGVCKNKW